MSAYTEHLSIQPFRDSGVWKWCLTAELHWEIGHKGSGIWITIPDGFVTDLASIPFWARWLLNPNRPETAKAAAVHDWLTPTILEKGSRPLWDCRTSAGELYAALRADGLPVWQCKLYYFAVVIGISEW